MKNTNNKIILKVGIGELTIDIASSNQVDILLPGGERLPSTEIFKKPIDTATSNLNTGDFSKITIFYSEESIVKCDEEVKTLFNKIYANQTQIRTLEKLRDTPLPKLMSGEVRVKI